jgi:hypothetical protein
MRYWAAYFTSIFKIIVVVCMCGFSVYCIQRGGCGHTVATVFEDFSRQRRPRLMTDDRFLCGNGQLISIVDGHFLSTGCTSMVPDGLQNGY